MSNQQITTLISGKTPNSTIVFGKLCYNTDERGNCQKIFLQSKPTMDPMKTILVDYDEQNRIISTTVPTKQKTTLVYDSKGQIDSVVYGNIKISNNLTFGKNGVVSMFKDDLPLLFADTTYYNGRKFIREKVGFSVATTVDDSNGGVWTVETTSIGTLLAITYQKNGAKSVYAFTISGGSAMLVKATRDIDIEVFAPQDSSSEQTDYRFFNIYVLMAVLVLVLFVLLFYTRDKFKDNNVLWIVLLATLGAAFIYSMAMIMVRR